MPRLSLPPLPAGNAPKLSDLTLYQDSLEPGQSVSTGDGAIGSIGCFAMHRTGGQPVLLSCQHVLGFTSAPGNVVPAWNRKRLYQPDNQDPYGYTKEIGQVSDGLLNGTCDAAIADLNDRRPAFWRSRYWPGDRTKLAMRHPSKDEAVLKIGQSTGLTLGIVRQTNTTIAHLGFNIPCIEIVPQGNPQNPFCKPGDSGAIWVSAQSGEMLGLHFHGLPVPGKEGRAYAIPLPQVFDLLKLRLPTPEELRPPPEPDPLIARAPDLAPGKAGNTGIA